MTLKEGKDFKTNNTGRRRSIDLSGQGSLKSTERLTVLSTLPVGHAHPQLIRIIRIAIYLSVL